MFYRAGVTLTPILHPAEGAGGGGVGGGISRMQDFVVYIAHHVYAVDLQSEFAQWYR